MATPIWADKAPTVPRELPKVSVTSGAYEVLAQSLEQSGRGVRIMSPDGAIVGICLSVEAYRLLTFIAEAAETPDDLVALLDLHSDQSEPQEEDRPFEAIYGRRSSPR